MKIDKKLASVAEQLLSQVDELGYQLDAIGVQNSINRHNLIAMAMFGQKRIEGELDSLSARAESEIAKVESVLAVGKQYLKSGAELAVFPATYTIGLLKERF